MKKNSFLLFVVLNILFFVENYAQTLDQQLRQAAQAGVLTPAVLSNLQTQSTNAKGIAALNQSRFFNQAPDGIMSLFSVPEAIEQVKLGYLTTYFPKGYGQNNLHFGIWNAIPFIVFDNNSLELRFGLIFENRQVGFVPDDWISTSIAGINLPTLEFLVPNAKTFLNFSQGASQWRATVLLTAPQIALLEEYANEPIIQEAEGNVYTVTHRFIDGSTRPYLIGLRHKSFFKIMIDLYNKISQSANIKTFQGTDEFPAAAFFDELTIENVIDDGTGNAPPLPDNTPAYEYDITEETVTETIPGEYGYEEYPAYDEATNIGEDEAYDYDYDYTYE